MNGESTYQRAVIENITPQIECGRFPIKRIAGEEVQVEADIFCDGHDAIGARLLYRPANQPAWLFSPMRHFDNDRWRAVFSTTVIGEYRYTIEAWVDHYGTWVRDTEKKLHSNQTIDVNLQIGAAHLNDAAARAPDEAAMVLRKAADMLTNAEDGATALSRGASQEILSLMELYANHSFASRYERELTVVVERARAGFSSWYELFPRSCAPAGEHGTLRDCAELIPTIAAMGFDVIYLPPIHPIGKTARKGKRNQTEASPGDPGSPWAIGSDLGGHTEVSPQLGSLEDLREFVAQARTYEIEVALDLAFQCSPDHPYLHEHPEWFTWRPDGSIQYAENPPKKYEDIVPFNFECREWNSLWEELCRVVEFWIKQGVTIFRVDNPHTKPLAFWEWLISRIKNNHPDILFLSEAFTRPKVMYRLAKIGFTQSYTYFTWRNTKEELAQYLTELTTGEAAEFFRPNFWPNTPDILPEFLQYGGRAAFMIRLILAATLSPNYGIYGPAFELCVSEAVPGKEEYLDSEKYEIKSWDRQAPGNITSLVVHINRIRRENPALQSLRNIRFLTTDNDNLLAYEKISSDGTNRIVGVVTLDPFHIQQGWVELWGSRSAPHEAQPFLGHDLLSGDRLIMHGTRINVTIDPAIIPARLIRIHHRLRREQDFDYFQ